MKKFIINSMTVLLVTVGLSGDSLARSGDSERGILVTPDHGSVGFARSIYQRTEQAMTTCGERSNCQRRVRRLQNLVNRRARAAVSGPELSSDAVGFYVDSARQADRLTGDDRELTSGIRVDGVCQNRGSQCDRYRSTVRAIQEESGATFAVRVGLADVIQTRDGLGLADMNNDQRREYGTVVDRRLRGAQAERRWVRQQLAFLRDYGRELYRGAEGRAQLRELRRSLVRRRSELRLEVPALERVQQSVAAYQSPEDIARSVSDRLAGLFRQSPPLEGLGAHSPSIDLNALADADFNPASSATLRERDGGGRTQERVGVLTQIRRPTSERQEGAPITERPISMPSR